MPVYASQEREGGAGLTGTPSGAITPAGQTWNTSETLEQLAANEPDLVLVLGDLVYADLYKSNQTDSNWYVLGLRGCPICGCVCVLRCVLQTGQPAACARRHAGATELARRAVLIYRFDSPHRPRSSATVQGLPTRADLATAALGQLGAADGAAAVARARAGCGRQPRGREAGQRGDVHVVQCALSKPAGASAAVFACFPLSASPAPRAASPACLLASHLAISMPALPPPARRTLA